MFLRIVFSKMLYVKNKKEAKRYLNFKETRRKRKEKEFNKVKREKRGEEERTKIESRKKDERVGEHI